MSELSERNEANKSPTSYIITSDKPKTDLVGNLRTESKPKSRLRRKHKKQETCGSCPKYHTNTKSSIHIQDSDSTEVESSTDEEERWKDVARGLEIPADYYNIQKLVKFIKNGNQTATIVSLMCLQDYDLKTQINQFAIQDIGGLDVLVNILECNEAKCRLGALTVLADISLNIDIRKTIVDLDGVPLIIDILNSSMKDLKTMAAETLANVARVRLGRKYVRKCGGIPKLVDLLDIKPNILTTGREDLTLDETEQLNMARAGAKALWSLADSRHNKEIMRKSGIVPLMARLLKSNHIDVVIPIMGTLQKCASEPKFQLAIKTEGMINNIVNHLYSSSTELIVESCYALYKCAFDTFTRNLVREAKGLEALVKIIRGTTNEPEHKHMLIGVTGALWMCSKTEENIRELHDLGAINYLISLLKNESEEVLTNTVGAISECVKYIDNCVLLRNKGGLPALVTLLNSSHAPLLENLAKALLECANDLESLEMLLELDAVRLIWSLMRNSNTRVQTAAAFAVCPCVRFAHESGELVRSLVGAMELVVDLLKSKDIYVLGAVCAAIATIAKDQTNLAILTDLKVIYKLASLVNTTDDFLRKYLADAIASCASFGNNTQELGRLRTVTPIVSYMTSDDPEVHRTTAMALEKLSMDPQNCITMHQSGVVPFLLECIGYVDKGTQLAAAGCLRNIRELALHAEEYLLKIDED